MKTNRSLMVVLSLLAAPLGAAAQVSGDMCRSLADTVAAGHATYLNKSRLDSMKYYAKCEASSNASSAALDVMYSAFSLGAKYNDSEKKSMCVTDLANLKQEGLEYAKVKQIFRDGVDLVSQCLQLAGRNWNIRQQLYKDAVSINVANLSPAGGEIRGIDLISSEPLECKDMPATFPLLVKADGISMLCRRTPRTQLVGGASQVEAEDAVVNLRFADGPIGIRLPGYTSSALDPVYAAIAGVGSDVEKLRGDLMLAGEELPSSGGNDRIGTCPPGTYMVSLRRQIDKGGPHGITSHLYPVCRRISK